MSATLSALLFLALPAFAAEVKGTNVGRVDCVNGTTPKSTFKQTPGTTGWVEKNESNTTFNWQERGRDEWSVYLNDTSRGYDLQLDLWTKKVTLSGNGVSSGTLCTVSAAYLPPSTTTRPKNDTMAQETACWQPAYTACLATTDGGLQGAKGCYGNYVACMTDGKQPTGCFHDAFTACVATTSGNDAGVKGCHQNYIGCLQKTY